MEMYILLESRREWRRESTGIKKRRVAEPSAVRNRRHRGGRTHITVTA